MWKRSFTTLFVILACGLAVSGQQKPVHETRHDMLTSRPPESPEQMADGSEAVVLARAINSSTSEDAYGGSWLVTTHNMQVVEVLKAGVLVPVDIKVMLLAERERKRRACDAT